MNKLKTIAIAILITVTAGCASSYKIPLTQEFKDTRQPVNFASIVPQKEIEARIRVSNGGVAAGAQFGLVGMMIGSAIDDVADKKSANSKVAQVAPLREAMIDFDFNSRIHKANISSAKAFEWLNIDKTSLKNDSKAMEFEEDQYLLRFNTQYQLSIDFDSVEVTTLVTLNKIEKKDNSNRKLKAKKNHNETTLFRNRYTYLSPSIPLKTKSQAERTEAVSKIEKWYEKEVGRLDELYTKQREPKLKSLKWKKKEKLKAANAPYTTAERNIAMAEEWAKNDAVLVKRYITDALIDIDKMIKLDVGDTLEPKDYKKDESIEIHTKGFQLVDKNEDRVMIRSVSRYIGILCSIKKDMNAKRCVIPHQ